VPIARAALTRFAASPMTPREPWGELPRRAFLGLLGAGRGLVETVDELDHYGLFTQLLPEWEQVRSRPQRNAFHVYTVDRHLLQTVVNAAQRLRDVSRPDLLLMGALLHDIGKGCEGDHTAAGMPIAVTVARRMGFSEDDVRTIRSVVEHHLLLPETATRRDLGDPQTIANVAAAVGDRVVLELLVHLTISDSLATGPTAWNAWKASLVDQLVTAVDAYLATGDAPTGEIRLDPDDVALADAVEGPDDVRLRHRAHGDLDALTIACRDVPGRFASIAGTLTLHGIDIVSAEAASIGDRVVDRFTIHPRHAAPGLWDRLAKDLRRAVSGGLDLDERLEQRRATYSRTRRVAATPPRLEISVSNAASTTATIVDVRAPDAVGVLYRLAHALAARGLDIRSAKVATLGHEVVDVFYVQSAGAQVPEEDHPALRTALAAALT
jgi:[protein-PII] uridylyltransferase